MYQFIYLKQFILKSRGGRGFGPGGGWGRGFGPGGGGRGVGGGGWGRGFGPGHWGGGGWGGPWWDGPRVIYTNPTYIYSSDSIDEEHCYIDEDGDVMCSPNF